MLLELIWFYRYSSINFVIDNNSNRRCDDNTYNNHRNGSLWIALYNSVCFSIIVINIILFDRSKIYLHACQNFKQK